MILQEFSYIALTERTGDVEKDVSTLLLANGRPATLTHVKEVAAVCAQIAPRFGVEREACVRAALLHDISAVIRREDMLSYARKNALPLCGAEEKLPFLLHQRLSRVVAAQFFGIEDENTLCAIECHTTLRAQATAMDMAVFIADKIAWDRGGTPPYEGEVRAALEGSLARACHAFMKYSNENGMVMYPHRQWTEAFAWLEGLCSCKTE